MQKSLFYTSSCVSGIKTNFFRKGIPLSPLPKLKNNRWRPFPHGRNNRKRCRFPYYFIPSFDGKVLPHSPSPKIEDKYYFFFFRARSYGHHQAIYRYRTRLHVTARKKPEFLTYVIAQNLTSAFELCYTFSGLRFMLSLNYAIRPQNGLILFG